MLDLPSSAFLKVERLIKLNKKRLIFLEYKQSISSE